ncbi:hypothetical protein SO802_003889 [Lithocarpus litseifolius]|uniref:Uncharacterized protein n=1 Tax=Lithocarpus litseifolius TaxID=425828 RepID=A0AAW2E5A4_9ROSI
MLCIASLDSSSPSRTFGYVLTSQVQSLCPQYQQEEGYPCSECVNALPTRENITLRLGIDDPSWSSVIRISRILAISSSNVQLQKPYGSPPAGALNLLSNWLHPPETSSTSSGIPQLPPVKPMTNGQFP